MTTFLLIRHGLTDAIGKSIMGWKPGWRLNAEGRKQVEILAEKLAPLPIRAVYTSPLERTMETAAAIALRHGLTPQSAEEIGEVRYGAWEGLTLAELTQREDWKQFNRFRSGSRAPGGEMMIELQARVVRFLDILRTRHPSDMVAVVSHGDPLRLAVGCYLGVPLQNLLAYEISPASVSVLEMDDRGSRLMLLNYPWGPLS